MLDKGNNTVLMWRNEYSVESENMLNDENIYKKLTADPTRKLQGKTNKFLKLLKDNDKMSEAQYITLVTHNSLSPKKYFLRKTHKNDLKLRPIVSCINSPTYKIGKYLHNILSNVLSTSSYNVKNSYTLAENYSTFCFNI